MQASRLLSRRRAVASLLGMSALVTAQNQNPPLAYPPVLEGARAEVYKTIGGVELKLWIIMPDGHREDDQRGAVVFFFGGGWNAGSPEQFRQQSRHFASRGMVAITADYRVASRHKVKIADCVRDAKSAIRWVRTNARRLGVDPNRIAAGGGSAGGHLAASAALINGLDELGENPKVSSRPDALVLFNPVLLLAPAAGVRLDQESIARRAELTGTQPELVSPYHHVRKGAPPTIIFHGRSDTTVLFETVQAFTTKMTQAGNRCELNAYEGQTHGFFNYGRANNEYYEKTLLRADRFLVSLGYLR